MVGRAFATTVALSVCIMSAPPMIAGTSEENGSAAGAVADPACAGASTINDLPPAAARPSQPTTAPRAPPRPPPRVAPRANRCGAGGWLLAPPFPPASGAGPPADDQARPPH